MIVGNKEKRINHKKRKQIQERRIKNLTLITSVIELARDRFGEVNYNQSIDRRIPTYRQN